MYYIYKTTLADFLEDARGKVFLNTTKENIGNQTYHFANLTAASSQKLPVRLTVLSYRHEIGQLAEEQRGMEAALKHLNILENAIDESDVPTSNGIISAQLVLGVLPEEV